ncbi:MAG: hypothetical protein LBD54_03475 [Puniceicoccales bacterium]|nr:hypothetical protein [Puniceicoccales bacterium]
MDRPLKVREEIFFYTARNSQASALKERLVALQNGVLKKYLYGCVSFEADDRSNQLMVVAPAANLAFVRKIIDGLDVDRDPLIRTEVFRIRHGAAKDLAEVIKKVVESQRRQEERANTYRLAQQRLSQASRILSQPSNPEGKGSPSTKAGENPDPGGENGTQAIQFSKALSLEADERSNSILAYGTQSDIAQIRSIIAKLDIVLDQVRIEVVVAQVKLTKGQVSGLESFGLSRDFDDQTAVGENNPISDASWVRTTKGSHDIRVFPASKLFSLKGNPLKHFSLEAVFNKARDDQNVKIMSAPTIVTTHNREAIVEVGESRPIITSMAADQTNINVRRSEITYKNIGLKLKVKPFIGSNGVIQMEIDQVVEKKLDDVEVNKEKQPVITRRQATSFVSVANQEVIVMAGLQEREQNFKKSKLWALGDLPVLGDLLFSSRDRSEITVELIIFIKPTIIAQPQDEQEYLEKRARAAGVYEDLKQYEEKGSFLDGSPFPSTTLGPVNSFDEPPVFSKPHRRGKRGKSALNQGRADLRSVEGEYPVSREPLYSVPQHPDEAEEYAWNEYDWGDANPVAVAAEPASGEQQRDSDESSRLEKNAARESVRPEEVSPTVTRRQGKGSSGKSRRAVRRKTPALKSSKPVERRSVNKRSGQNRRGWKARKAGTPAVEKEEQAQDSTRLSEGNSARGRKSLHRRISLR